MGTFSTTAPSGLSNPGYQLLSLRTRNTTFMNFSINKTFAIAIAVFVAAAMLMQPAQAAHTPPDTIHVDGGASGAEDGTSQADAFTTIQEGVDHAGTGDTIQVADGTYNENVTIEKSDITLISENGAGSTTISPGSGRAIDIKAQSTNQSDITIEGFTLTSGSSNAIILQANSQTNDGYDSFNLLYKDLVIDANGGFGIGLFDSDGAKLRNVSIDNAEIGIEAIGLKGFNMQNSSISNSSDVGVNIWALDGYEDNHGIGITNSIFTDNNQAINIAGATNVVIRDNDISGGFMGVMLHTVDGTNTVKGNTIEGLSSSSNNSTGVWLAAGKNINVEDNTLSNISSSEKTTQGILIGGTAQEGVLENISVVKNIFENIEGDPGAFGIMVNRDLSGDKLRVIDNSFSVITGDDWMSAVGLDADTPEAEVIGNDFSDLSVNASGGVPVGINVNLREGNDADPQLLKIKQNNLFFNNSEGVVGINYDSGKTTPDNNLKADRNYWNDQEGPSGPFGETADSSGAIVGEFVDYSPWLCNEAYSSQTTTDGECEPEGTIGSEEDPHSGNVSICHTQDNGDTWSNPNPNINGIVNEGHGGHEDDIIPPFWYDDGKGKNEDIKLYPGKNWDSEGQAFWDNNCGIENEPEEPHQCIVGEELLENGGFEHPVVDVDTTPGWDVFVDGTSGLGWAVNWISGLTHEDLPEDALIELHNGVNNWSPFTGDQYTELDSDWDGPGGSVNGEPASTEISQIVPTVTDKWYEISFAYSPRPGVEEDNNKLEVYWDGSLIDTISRDGSSTSDTDWSEHSYILQATSEDTELRLADAGEPSDSLGTFVDDVSVACSACDQATHVIYSNEQTEVNGEPAVEIQPHPNWTSIDGAVWIWDEELDENDSHPVETEVFTRDFTITGTPSGATLEISADNGYSVLINGNPFGCEDADEHNWSEVDTCPIAADDLFPGTNIITFTVENYEGSGANPAGLLYKLTIDENQCVLPELESRIILPPEGADPYSQGPIDLKAFYADENGDGDDAVQWAVRQGTCSAGTNTVAGNVDGFNTPFDWDGTDFDAVFDASSATPDDYCFIFNPTEDGGDENQRLTRVFTIEGEEEPLYACSSPDVLHLDVSDSSEAKLYSVDTSTGVATSIQTYPGLHPLDLAADSDGTLYSTSRNGTDTGDLIILEAGGTATTVGATGLSDKTTAMNFAPDGTLYAMGTDEDKLYEIDKTTGSATELHSFSSLDVAGGDLVVDGQNQLVYVRNTGEVYVVDIDNAYNTTHIGDLPSGNYTSTALLDDTHYAMSKSGDTFVSFSIDPFSSSVIDSDVGPFEFGDGTSCPVDEEESEGGGQEPPQEPDPEPETDIINIGKWHDNDPRNGNWDDEPGLEWDIVVKPQTLSEEEVIFVDSSDENGTTTVTSLESGKTYLVEVEGTYFFAADHDRIADAEYYTNDNWNTVGDWEEDNPSDDPRTLDLIIDDKNVDWGSYDGENHLYKTVIEGNDEPLDLRIFERQSSHYPDNEGELEVRIYDVTAHIHTTDPETGLEEVEVPEGQYQIVEIPQEGWVQTAPDTSYCHIDTTQGQDTCHFGNFFDEGSIQSNPEELETDLEIDKDVNTAGSEGASVTYIITVVNNGPDDATGVVVTDILPAGVTYDSHSTDDGTFDPNSGEWTIGDLDDGESNTVTLEINATINSGTEGEEITNTAEVSGNEEDPESENDTDGTSFIVSGVQSNNNTNGNGDNNEEGDNGNGEDNDEGGNDDDNGDNGNGINTQSFAGGNGPIGAVGFSSGGGSVLGAFTSIEENDGDGRVLGASCEPLLSTYLRRGHNNDAEEVLALQKFLRDEVPPGPPMTAVFDEATEESVNEFQLKYAEEILDPWIPHGLEPGTPTGYVYKTTRRWINLLHCSSLDIPIPILP